MAEQHKKILIIDDDTFLLNMYSLKFSKSNYEVITAQNGTDALAKLKDGTYKPDIILIDVIMPGLDGIELLAEIRKLNLVPDSSIIMLTNQSDSADIEKAKTKWQEANSKLGVKYKKFGDPVIDVVAKQSALLLLLYYPI